MTDNTASNGGDSVRRALNPPPLGTSGDNYRSPGPPVAGETNERRGEQSRFDFIREAFSDHSTVELLGMLQPIPIDLLVKLVQLYEQHRDSICALTSLRRHAGDGEPFSRVVRRAPMETVERASRCPYSYPDEQASIRDRLTRAEPKKRPSSLRAKRGFVYLMQNERNGFYKIGFSIKPEVRERTLQAEDPQTVLLTQWPGTMEDERALHEYYAAVRVRGEWFRLTADDVTHIKANMNT